LNAWIYEEIDLSEWMAANPPDVLATNFGQPAALFEKFPRRDVFITDSQVEIFVGQERQALLCLFGSDRTRTSWFRWL
jgi:hypothetical protein